MHALPKLLPLQPRRRYGRPRWCQLRRSGPRASADNASEGVAKEADLGLRQVPVLPQGLFTVRRSVTMARACAYSWWARLAAAARCASSALDTAVGGHVPQS